MSCETGFVSMKPEQEPKEVLKLSETKGLVSVLSEYTETGMFRFFRLFRFKKEPKNRKEGERREKGEGK